ncbi:MAG TPA: sigma-70 family RNA polymerase sigma factor [Tepidisphaeraceae bacterium]|jgi:RNA polymerase sigma-70 factor (ECF subfamily)
MDVAQIELVRRAQLKDATAFAELVQIYQRMCLSVAFKVLSDASSAGDVTQDAFIKAWDRLVSLREPSHFGTWLCGIVRNLAVDRVRRRRRAETLGPGCIPAKAHRWTIDPVDDICRRESQDMIAGALADLDDTARTALTMRYYDRLPSKQIARVLGISPDAVDMRLIRARKRLKAALPQLKTA